MQVRYTYYAFNEKPSYDGTYGVSDYVSPLQDITVEGRIALEIYFGCTVFNNNDLTTLWNKRATALYIQNNMEKCLPYIRDECGNQGTYPEDYEFDSFVESVMDALPQSFWDYAQASDVNPQGYSEPVGIFHYEVV